MTSLLLLACRLTPFASALPKAQVDNVDGPPFSRDHVYHCNKNPKGPPPLHSFDFRAGAEKLRLAYPRQVNRYTLTQHPFAEVKNPVFCPIVPPPIGTCQLTLDYTMMDVKREETTKVATMDQFVPDVDWLIQECEEKGEFAGGTVLHYQADLRMLNSTLSLAGPAPPPLRSN